jgi:hypothetical protein
MPWWISAMMVDWKEKLTKAWPSEEVMLRETEIAIRKPAKSLRDVEDAERRLGVRLPDDVRSLYLWTDGLQGVDWSIERLDDVDWVMAKDREVGLLYSPESKTDAAERRRRRRLADDGMVFSGALDLRRAISLSPYSGRYCCWFIDASKNTPDLQRVICLFPAHGHARLWAGLFDGLSRAFKPET